MGSRRPPRPSDNAAIARALRSDSDLMRYSEWWVRRRIYGLEDASVLWLVQQFEASYRELLADLPAAYDLEGRPILAQRLRLLAQVEREINAMYDALGVRIPQDVEDGFRQGYYGRAWLLDTVTVPEFVASKRVLLPSEAIRALLVAEYIGTDEWIELHRREVIDRIKRSLTASMIQGEGIQKAAARLRQELGIEPGQRSSFKGATWKSLLIARTEILRASNLGALAIYEENQDVLSGWEWVATRDERTCFICRQLDGKVFLFDSNTAHTVRVNNKGATRKVRTPPPSESHPGCRCTAVPVLRDEDLMQEVGGVRETYADWAANNVIVNDGGLTDQRSADAHGDNTTSAQGSAA